MFPLLLALHSLAFAVEQHAVYEAVFASKTDPANPYTAITAEARITRPNNAAPWTIPLFWDGSNTFKLRLSPDLPGRWSYTITSTDPALNGKRGTFDVTPSQRKGGIRASRQWPGHFERQDGSPFFYMGDTAWGYLTDIPEEHHARPQAEAHARTRAAQGFTVFHVMALSEHGVGNNGGLPWQDIAAEKLNPAYWQEVDSRIAFANRQGITVAIAIAWGDKRKVEPFAWRRFPNVEARKRYARYMAARYSAYDVYFLVSGEWHGELRTRDHAVEEDVFQEFVSIGETLAAADPHHRMISIHPMTAAGTVREFGISRWFSFADYQQNYRQLHDRILLSRNGRGPVVNSEYGYHLRDQNGDGKPDKANSYHVDDMRVASWDIAMAGGYFVSGFGTTYFAGVRDPGLFNLDDPKNDDWEAQVSHLHRFFTGLEWWRLTPADLLVSCPQPRTADRGTGTGQDVRPPERTFWAMADPGRTYVVYTRGISESIRLEFQAHAKTYRARLFSPRTGAFQDLGSAKPQPSYSFTPPDSGDWVLLLDSQSRSQPLAGK